MHDCSTHINNTRRQEILSFIKQHENLRIKLLHFLVFVDTAENVISDVILSWCFFISPDDGGVVYKVRRCLE